MKKILILLSFCLVSLVVSSQDVVVLKHKEYTSHFSKSKKYPVMVEWWATRAKVGCPTPLPRKDNFKPDPLLPTETNLGADYLKSGYDRGHVSPAADNLCMTAEIQDECFYFSNMIPQTHTLNAGIWKTLEVHTRTLAMEQDSIHVWAGAVGDKGKIGKVTIPTQCWKVIYVKKSREWTAFLFENDKTKPGSLNEVRVTLDDIQRLTLLKFNQ